MVIQRSVLSHLLFPPNTDTEFLDQESACDIATLQSWLQWPFRHSPEEDCQNLKEFAYSQIFSKCWHVQCALAYLALVTVLDFTVKTCCVHSNTAAAVNYRRPDFQQQMSVLMLPWDTQGSGGTASSHRGAAEPACCISLCSWHSLHSPAVTHSSQQAAFKQDQRFQSACFPAEKVSAGVTDVLGYRSWDLYH